MNNSFLRFGATAAILTGILSILYAVFFLFVSRVSEITGILASWIILGGTGFFAAAAYVALLASPRWQRAFNKGARPQRLLWASTGTKDPQAEDVLYIRSLAAPFTVNTMPEATLKALADHGQIESVLPADGGGVSSGWAIRCWCATWARPTGCRQTS